MLKLHTIKYLSIIIMASYILAALVRIVAVALCCSSDETMHHAGQRLFHLIVVTLLLNALMNKMVQWLSNW